MMGGELSVQSTPGKGSTFTISLKNVPVSLLSTQTENPQGLHPDTIHFEPSTLLVVDDKPLNRELLIQYMVHSPFEIIQAENGREAIELARQYRPDIVLMDFKMPVMDGKEATERFKEDPRLKDIPIITVSALAAR